MVLQRFSQRYVFMRDIKTSGDYKRFVHASTISKKGVETHECAIALSNSTKQLNKIENQRYTCTGDYFYNI
jgi:hypothetical protein